MSRQELLFYKGLYQWRRDGKLEEAKSLFETILHSLRKQSQRAGKQVKTQERSKTGKLSGTGDGSQPGKSGKMEESSKEGIPPKGYEILVEGYDNLLADIGKLDDALALDDKAVRNFLKTPHIRCLASMFYHMAWNIYESASQPGQNYEVCRQKWQDAFLISETLADYIYDSRFQAHLAARREKFL